MKSPMSRLLSLLLLALIAVQMVNAGSGIFRSSETADSHCKGLNIGAIPNTVGVWQGTEIIQGEENFWGSYTQNEDGSGHLATPVVVHTEPGQPNDVELIAQDAAILCWEPFPVLSDENTSVYRSIWSIPVASETKLFCEIDVVRADSWSSITYPSSLCDLGGESLASGTLTRVPTASDDTSPMP